MRATVIQYNNHNQFRITGWAEDKVRLEPSQGKKEVRNIHWMVTEMIHNNQNEFMATKLQSGITIRAVSDGSYHPTYQYGTSAWIIKIPNNDRTTTGANFLRGGSKSQCSCCSELCGLIGTIRNIKKSAVHKTLFRYHKR